MRNIYREKDISWLQGFFDGEGGLQYSRYKMPKQWHTTKRIAVTNTAIENVIKIRKCLKNLGIDFREFYQEKREKAHRKKLYIIYVERKEAIKKFAILIGFTEKRKQKLLNKILGSFDDRHRPNKKKLINLYNDKKMCMVDIGKEFGFSQSAVVKWMKKYGIKRRNRNEWIKLSWNKRGKK